METINWKEIEDRLVEAGEEVVSKVPQNYPDQVFYGMVIELGQNWVFELHLNTEAGLAEGVAKFRSGSHGYEAKSDAEIAATLGRWYFGTWKFQNLSFSVGEKLKELNQENYERLEAAYGEANSDQEGEAILSGFANATVAAAKRLKSSPIIQKLNRTQDFTIHIAGDDGLEYFTKKHL